MTPDERARFDELIYRFNELVDTVESLRDDVGKARQDVLYNGGRGNLGGGGGFPISMALTGAGGILAGESDDVELQELVGGALPGGSLVAGATVTCNNGFSTDVEPNTLIAVGQDFQGNYFVLSEDCP